MINWWSEFGISHVLIIQMALSYTMELSLRCQQEYGCLCRVMCKKIHNLACARVFKGEENTRKKWRMLGRNGDRGFAWLNIHCPKTSIFKDYVPLPCSASTTGRQLYKMKRKIDLWAHTLHLSDDESQPNKSLIFWPFIGNTPEKKWISSFTLYTNGFCLLKVLRV